MPQLNKGGKFVFGLSVIHENRSVQIPPQAINEYRLSNENKIIIFTGSKITGGFCVTSYPLLSSSKLSHIAALYSGRVRLSLCIPSTSMSMPFSRQRSVK